MWNKYVVTECPWLKSVVTREDSSYFDLDENVLQISTKSSKRTRRLSSDDNLSLQSCYVDSQISDDFSNSKILREKKKYKQKKDSFDEGKLLQGFSDDDDSDSDFLFGNSDSESEPDLEESSDTEDGDEFRKNVIKSREQTIDVTKIDDRLDFKRDIELSKGRGIGRVVSIRTMGEGSVEVLWYKPSNIKEGIESNFIHVMVPKTLEDFTSWVDMKDIVFVFKKFTGTSFLPTIVKKILKS